MLMCWNEKPEKRPHMSVIQQDLDEFGPALVENKYDYSTSEYMKREGLTNVVPGRGRKGTKQHAREEIAKGRVRRKQRQT